MATKINMHSTYFLLSFKDEYKYYIECTNCKHTIWPDVLPPHIKTYAEQKYKIAEAEEEKAQRSAKETQRSAEEAKEKENMIKMIVYAFIIISIALLTMWYFSR
ncbi:MAG: hypothetical protein Q8O41_11180 [Candidatus Methanoperedens sp.]|nr:hypothetical protein [Candidatus Methanoperedens sp.]